MLSFYLIGAIVFIVTVVALLAVSFNEYRLDAGEAGWRRQGVKRNYYAGLLLRSAMTTIAVMVLLKWIVVEW